MKGRGEFLETSSVFKNVEIKVNILFTSSHRLPTSIDMEIVCFLFDFFHVSQIRRVAAVINCKIRHSLLLWGHRLVVDRLNNFSHIVKLLINFHHNWSYLSERKLCIFWWKNFNCIENKIIHDLVRSNFVSGNNREVHRVTCTNKIGQVGNWNIVHFFAKIQSKSEINF